MSAGKIKSLDELCGIVDSERKAGMRFALANGIFDVLHVGHVRYLEAARKLADRLIVAVNSDASAAILKGEGRPFQPAAERAELLSAFGCVDFVVVFDDPTVEKALLRLRPEVHVKGTDYTAESVPEKDVVASYGGRVAIAGDPKSHSSTGLIERILRPHINKRT